MPIINNGGSSGAGIKLGEKKIVSINNDIKRGDVGTLLNSNETFSEAVTGPICSLSYNKDDYNIASLSNKKALVCYYTNDAIYAQLLTVSGVSITIDKTVKISSKTCVECNVVALSDTKAVVFYTDRNERLYSNVLTISGASITVGTEINNGIYIHQFIFKALSDTKVICCYEHKYDSNNEGDSYFLYSRVFTISGTSITSGTEVKCAGSINVNAEHVDISVISDKKAVICFVEFSSDYIYSNVLTISGTLITPGAQPSLCLNNSKATDVSAAVLSDTKVLLCHNRYDYSASKYVSCYQFLTVSDTSVTPGTIIDINSEQMYLMNFKTFSDTKAFLCHATGGLIFMPLTISGTSVTFGKENNLDSSGVVDRIRCVALSNTTAIIAYVLNSFGDSHITYRVYVSDNVSFNKIESAKYIYTGNDHSMKENPYIPAAHFPPKADEIEVFSF